MTRFSDKIVDLRELSRLRKEVDILTKQCQDLAIENVKLMQCNDEFRIIQRIKGEEVNIENGTLQIENIKLKAELREIKQVMMKSNIDSDEGTPLSYIREKNKINAFLSGVKENLYKRTITVNKGLKEESTVLVK